jgi:hypothetical protein
MTAENRWDYVSTLSSMVKRCGDATEDGCGYKQPDKIKLEGMTMIYAIWDSLEKEKETAGEDKKIKIRLTPEYLLKLFEILELPR